MSKVIYESSKKYSEHGMEKKKVVKENGNYYLKTYDNPHVFENEDELVDEIEINGEFIKDIAFNFYNHKLNFDFVDGVDWDKLAEYYGVEIEGTIGYDHPIASKSNPRFRDYSFYAKIVGEEKYLTINKVGEHEIIEISDYGHPIEFV